MSELDLSEFMIRFPARLFLTLGLSDISEHDRRHADLHSVAVCEDGVTISILIDAGDQTFPFSFSLSRPVDPVTFDLEPIRAAILKVLH